MTGTLIALGLVNWLVTLILVESEITRPFRDAVTRRARRRVPATWRTAAWRTVAWRTVAWRKAAYLVSCHLCTGTWVALLLAALVPVRPLGTGAVGLVLAGLLIKSIGHITLEITALMKRTSL